MTRLPEVFVKSLVAVLLAVFAPLSFAQTAPMFSPTWSWTPPAKCTDGTPITNCPVTKFTLYTGLFGTPLATIWTVAPNLTSVSTPNTPAGKWCGQVNTEQLATLDRAIEP